MIKVGGRQPAARTPVPTVSNIRIVPSQNDPTWVDEVEGDMLNPGGDLMTRARLSVVLLNAAGAVVGGGVGSSSGSLPAKARQFVKVSSDVDLVAAHGRRVRRVHRGAELPERLDERPLSHRTGATPAPSPTSRRR